MQQQCVLAGAAAVVPGVLPLHQLHAALSARGSCLQQQCVEARTTAVFPPLVHLFTSSGSGQAAGGAHSADSVPRSCHLVHRSGHRPSATPLHPPRPLTSHITLLALLKLPLQLLRLLLQLASFLYSTFSHSLSHSLSLSLASSLKALSLHLAYFVKTLMQPLTYSIKALSQSLTYSYISVANSISYASKAVSSSLRLVGGALKLGSATKAVGQRISAAGSAWGRFLQLQVRPVVRSPSSSLLQMWKNLFQKLFRAIMWIFKVLAPSLLLLTDTGLARGTTCYPRCAGCRCGSSKPLRPPRQQC
ncbi:hypothetical protein CLOM_g6783 [Closterium sp. NIES-68]|nr:hypothetical protein CLOM_g6783 [Closterium sp. NIES-68]